MLEAVYKTIKNSSKFFRAAVKLKESVNSGPDRT